MFDLLGTPNDWNFFSRDFSNHIPMIKNPNTAQKALANKFATMTYMIQ